MHDIYLPQMVKTLVRQVTDVGCEGQHTVEQHAKTHCFSGDLDVDAHMPDGQESKLIQLVRCTKPNELSFVMV